MKTPQDKQKYKIVRRYFDETKPAKIMQRGLTLEEAQAHCQRDDTHAPIKDGVRAWFDGYTEEGL